MCYDKNLLNQKSEDEKMKWHDLESLELFVASVDCIYKTFAK